MPITFHEQLERGFRSFAGARTFFECIYDVFCHTQRCTTLMQHAVSDENTAPSAPKIIFIAADSANRAQSLDLQYIAHQL